MAAAAEPAELADSQPFSPSDFLNLPPTPRLDVDVDDDREDLVLPFISRMLMEEEAEMDSGFLEQYHPDHPALLQAQQPFADILSGAGAANGSGRTTLSSPASAAFANATWPYDPVELSQLLHSSCRSTTYPAADTATAYPNAADSLSQASSTTTTTTMSGGGTVSMDMLNLAFLKGMEEASKLLPMPATTSLLMPVDDGVDRDHHRSKLWRRPRQPQPKKPQPQVDGNVIMSSHLLLQLQQQQSNGSRGARRRRKNTDWEWDADDDADNETTKGGRRSGKVQASESEESELVDEFVESGYQSLHEQMRAMSIFCTATDSSIRKGTKKGRSAAAADEAVDLRTLLIHCAQAVAGGDRGGATGLLTRIRERSSPSGDATQRLAHCFAKGLQARLAGTGNQLYGLRSLMANSKLGTVELFRAYQLYLASCCFTAMAFKFSNMAIRKAIIRSGKTKTKKKKVHIVDYGGNSHYGLQWPTLLGYWGAMEGGAPDEVRITAVDHPQPGFRPAARIQDTGRRLTTFARRHGVPSFSFHSVVAANWETLTADDLTIDGDEVLVVNGLFHFGNRLSDEATSSSPDDDDDDLSPRDMVLGSIRRMRPDAFVLCVENSSHNAPFFVTRFREALFFYSALFDMMDALAPRDSHERILLEQRLLGTCALNAIACEGPDRVERHETYRRWQARCERAGLRQLPLDTETVKGVSRKVKETYHKDFVVDVDHRWILQGWKGRILYAMSAWVANDD